MKQALEQALQAAVNTLLQDQPNAKAVMVKLSRPKVKEHGDYSANIAMALAGILKQKPLLIAQTLLQTVQWPDAVDAADIASPGFINIRLKDASEAQVLKTILNQGEAFGRITPTQNAKKVCLEFVSANPTGPMHVGHARGAIVGDALGRLLAARGLNVHREYYINDAGAQIGVLAASVWLRMRELQGESIDFPEGVYPGEYIIDIARQLLTERDFSELKAMPEDQRETWIGEQSVAANMVMIRSDLAAMGIEFDHYFSESTLHTSGKVNALIQQLQAEGVVYKGALPPPKGKEVENYTPVEQLLFRTTDFGDDVDRPLAKQDGTATYFAADIAYHKDKHERGFDRLIDIWGADHGGYVTRVQAAMKALTVWPSAVFERSAVSAISNTLRAYLATTAAPCLGSLMPISLISTLFCESTQRW